MSDLYKLDKDNRGVVTVSLNRPELHNAFNDQLIAELTQEFISMNTDESVKLVVLTGEGRSFCAGADLNWMKQMKDYTDEENFEDSKKLAGLFEAINNFRRPVIGKVNGAALGGGAGLVAVCDYIIASEKAKFGFTEVRLGLVPAVISPYVIAKIGESNARVRFLTGDRFGGDEAIAMGLIHKVSLDRYFEKDVNEAIDSFLNAGPKAQSLAKELIKNVVQLQVLGDRAKLTDYTCNTIAKARTSDEGQEGMAALLEKRKPNWMVD
jgi:methylglutaconyl-CoA hydratase